MMIENINLAYYLAFSSIVVGSLSYSIAEISNDIVDLSRENLPKPVTYFTLPPTEDVLQSDERVQEARFTIPHVTTNVESLGHNTMTHGYYPWKFDLGGVLLGGMVGLGALLLIPKVINLLVPELGALGPAYGSPYKRNVEFLPGGINEMASQFEKVLAENNINSSECLQKALCSYIQTSASKFDDTSSASNAEKDIFKSFSETLISFVIDGSKFKTAIENGKQGVPCSALYPKCPFTQESVTSRIKQLILSNTTSFPHHQEFNSRSL